MRFAIFPLHLSKVLRLPGKRGAKSHEVLHLSRKIILANLKIGCSKMQPLSGNQRPDLLTSLIKMSLVLRLPRAMVFADPLQMSHACYRFEHVTKPSRLITCDKVQNPLRLPHKTMLQRPKVARTCGVLTFWFWHVLHATTPCTFQHLVNLVVRDSQFLTLWTLKCASLQDGVHFFNISTSKSGPRQSVFNTLDFEMPFTPQGRALFQHLNFQKWSGTVSF